MMSGNDATALWARRGGIDWKINGGAALSSKLGREGTDVLIGGGIVLNPCGVFHELEWSAPLEPNSEKTDNSGDGMEEWIEAFFLFLFTPVRDH